MSFHATKSFLCGEGGAVARSDSKLGLQIGTARDSRSASTNGKLSEYHAAAGLAELDTWQEKPLLLAVWPPLTGGYLSPDSAD